MGRPLEFLLQHPGIWRGDRISTVALPSIPTGFYDLDAQLPGGGWPRGALTEIIHEREGIGELRLLIPVLARLSLDEFWIAWINPPYLPYAPALAGLGVDLSRIMIIRTQSASNTLWAMEQALRSGSCAAALAWPNGLNERSLRKLQLAAETGKSWGVYFTPANLASAASSAALRLRLSPQQGRLKVQVIKRRGGGWAAPLMLTPGTPSVADTALQPSFALQSR